MHVPGQRPESEAALVAALGALGDSPPRAVSEVGVVSRGSSAHPGCNRRHPGCNRVHPDCNRRHPGCNRVYPGCNRMYPGAHDGGLQDDPAVRRRRGGGAAAADSNPNPYPTPTLTRTPTPTPTPTQARLRPLLPPLLEGGAPCCHVRPGASITLCMCMHVHVHAHVRTGYAYQPPACCTHYVPSTYLVRTGGAGHLAPVLLYARRPRTSLGRAVRTAHRGTTGCGAASVWITHNQEQAERVGGCRVSFVPDAAV